MGIHDHVYMYVDECVCGGGGLGGGSHRVYFGGGRGGRFTLPPYESIGKRYFKRKRS